MGKKKGIADPFKKIGDAFKQIGNSFKKISSSFKCIGQIFKAIGSYIDCGLKMIINMPSCILYYILDCMFFIFVYLPIWLCCLICPPLKPIVDGIGSALYSVDAAVHGATGFHIFKYQDSVQKRCYGCKVKPFPAFKSDGTCQTKSKNVPILYSDCKSNSTENTFGGASQLSISDGDKD